MATDSSDRERFERPEQLLDQRTKKRLLRGVQGLVLLGLLVYVLFPLYWSVTSAFKTTAELFQTPPAMIPQAPTLENFQRVMFDTIFPVWFMNSIIVSIMATVLATGLAALGGYGLTRANFGAKRSVARSILFVYMFPPILLALPLFVLFYQLDVLNSHISLALAHTALALPFAVWIMWQYFQTIPMSFEESAWINGASRLRAIWDIVLPMAMPGLIAVAIINFSFSWNDYTMAVTLMTDSEMLTFPVGVNQFIQQTAVHWGLIQAATVYIMLPAFLLVLFLQKYLIIGFGATDLE